MKSVEQLTAERDTLQSALAEAQHLVNDRSTRAYAVQACTAQVVLGTKNRSDLEKAQSQLNESVEALLRVDHLRQAIASIDEQITVARGAERRQSCEAIKAEHDALYQTYKEQARTMLATFKQLQQLNFSHMGLTGRELHGAHERELNLPQVSGSLASRSNITTGQEG